jgi:dTDP-4-amino-4,6-dideoxygalactose transaminase
MKVKLLFILIFIANCSFSQSINDDKTSVTNFIKRMYNSAPFEGVKVIDDYDHQYFISVLSLEKGKYPTAQALSNSLLSLPISQFHNKEMINYVGETMKKARSQGIL